MNTNKKSKRTGTLLILTLALATLFASCSTTAPLPGSDSGEPAPADSAAAPSGPSSMQQILNANRSSLADLHATQQNDLPEALMQQREVREEPSDPTAGYRIQIHSGRNLQLADSVAASYRMWSDTTLTGYQADTYTFFQQPFYKVHVGDFSDRRRAETFNDLVQRRFPDAWVVHDRIEPEQVPADTVQFGRREG